jgi:hypothetical protein
MRQLIKGRSIVPFKLPARIKPTKGYSHLFYIGLNLLLPLLAYILVRIDFVSVAIVLVLLSKWRMFAVRPRYWVINLIQNGVDIMVAVSLIIFMASTSVVWWQLLWAAAYGTWLVWLKPRYDVLSVLAARHYLTSFEESHSALLAHIWGYFAASLAFVLGHWLLFYGTIAQIIVILTTIGYGLAALYYLDATQRLSKNLNKQLLGIMLAILLIIVLFSNWTGSTL